jgi:hypothetical protein
MKNTYLYNQGYRFYVYVPGVGIEYFYELEKAQDYADTNDVKVHELF